MSPATRPAPTVVKLGGSLVADGTRLRGLLGGLADGEDGPCVVVPGGGPFADAVRNVQGALNFDDVLAHRLALDAMGRMAQVFCAIEPRLTLACGPDEALAILDGGGTPVWDPIALKSHHPAIPETWAVTSDSLGLWLAIVLRAPRCILVKSADRPTGTDLADLVRLGLVDAAFPDFARRYPGEIVIRGPGGSSVKAAA